MFETVLGEVKTIVGDGSPGPRMSRLLLKAGLAVLVALAAGLGIGIGLQLSGPPLAGDRAPAASRRPGRRPRTSSGPSWGSRTTSGPPS